MGHKFAEIGFTQAVKTVQAQLGSRKGYERMEGGEDFNHRLGVAETEFIQARDSFYMASVSETDWPYIQHRGGPKGFMKVLDEKTLGFADYNGNRQYISTGNFASNDKVSLFFMDYPNKTRLKLLGRIKLVDTADHELLTKLQDDDYRARVERAFVIQVEAFDWNCPKHITPRFSEAEVEEIVAAKLSEAALSETKQLEAKPVEKTENVWRQSPATLGEGPLSLVISGIRQLTPEIRAFEFKAAGGGELPLVTAGSHIRVPVQLNDGSVVHRSYSICSNPSRRNFYEIAVLATRLNSEADDVRQDDLHKSASHGIHHNFQLGTVINCDLPGNHFEVHLGTEPAVLIAGGIGITVIKPLAQHFKSRGVALSLHYSGRSVKDMAFRDRLQREFGESISIYPSDESRRLSISQVLSSAPKNTIFYICGPQKMLNEVRFMANQLDIDSSRIRSEGFGGGAETSIEDKAFTVKLVKSKLELNVAANKSVLDTLLAADIDTPFSCQSGSCKQCAIPVIEGDIEHRDTVLTHLEKEQLQLFCPCVSRAKTPVLALDL
ncbi:2Fe-2S iron-sulfur cluster-binding protein [Shewanella benthica]|uniref:2Fe-2S iron-sulfur cluster-binding protein n=1 Tax=Shewanella benthica TaxID=43661 RepID=UPI00187B0888|nr:2Fe-2S iron-sulfur cluster-binding protein [Shewanella benthica]MBE7214338.1 2Fe-2S iron-sulfur cluster binding domain-containing protein [Shewanella benthica]MCL1064119.1 2Fe-2S iron-sulfur cluster-binding protein [Shewanella benthica]